MGIPKQYRLLLGLPVFIHSVKIFLSHSGCKALVVVVPVGDTEIAKSLIERFVPESSDVISIVEGGKERNNSVMNGVRHLYHVGELADAVLIHDAARPGLTLLIVEDLLDALQTVHGAAPGLPMVDALKLMDENGVRSVDRTNLYRIQTPQAFRSEISDQLFSSETDQATDDLQMAETLGLTTTITRGSERLSKVTYTDDFVRMERMMSSTAREFRTGLGYDVHAFERGEAVSLCGVTIPHSFGLKGHSDADVAWHALTDALLERYVMAILVIISAN